MKKGKLYQNADGTCILLALEDSNDDRKTVAGVILQGDSFTSVGDVSRSWDSTMFTEFVGTLSLNNVTL